MELVFITILVFKVQPSKSLVLIKVTVNKIWSNISKSGFYSALAVTVGNVYSKVLYFIASNLKSKIFT